MKNIFSILVVFLLGVFTATPAKVENINNINYKKSPLVIAPMIEAQGYCKAGFNEPHLGAAIAYCAQHNEFGIKELSAALNLIEPKGAKGDVQIGYTIGINLLENQDDGAFNPFGFLTHALNFIDRPAVIYLFANHFAGTTAKPPVADDSMAKFADQSTPRETYFKLQIAPIALQTDPKLSINQQRNKALQKIGAWYQSLPEKSKNKIIAFTLMGELHHFYDDFSKGMGKFEDIHITDYSKAVVSDFQKWLQKNYIDIIKFNEAMGTEYHYFNQINPPSKRIQSDKLEHFTQHFDSFAHGIVPIEGWLEKMLPQHQITIYLNGVAIGVAEYGLNRQDVYESSVTIKNARVGFRYLLNFKKLPRGKYTLQAILENKNKNKIQYELARRSLSIMGQSQEPIVDLSDSKKISKLLKNTPRFYLDRPAHELALFYNPLARDWLEFRSQQVTAAYDYWFDAAKLVGLPENKLFSHQIAVATVGGWNPVLFASDASLQGKKRYHKGINLYGGSASMALLRTHYIQPGDVFGIPEFHSQSWKDATEPGKILNDLKSGGASFISPYFLSMAPDKYRDKPNDHDKFRLSLNNKNYGSNYLYRAIIDIAKK